MRGAVNHPLFYQAGAHRTEAVYFKIELLGNVIRLRHGGAALRLQFYFGSQVRI